jgi:hypothetical protein
VLDAHDPKSTLRRVEKTMRALLPEVETPSQVAEENLSHLQAAIERAEIVRRWHEDAARYACPTFDEPGRLPECGLARMTRSPRRSQ